MHVPTVPCFSYFAFFFKQTLAIRTSGHKGGVTFLHKYLQISLVGEGNLHVIVSKKEKEKPREIQ